MELADQEFKQETSFQDEPVDITVNCMTFSGNAATKGITDANVQTSTNDAHDLVCSDRGLPKAYTDATTRSTRTPFTNFFSSSDKATVAGKLKTCRDKVQRSGRIMTYNFRASSCSGPEDIAYSRKNVEIINLCQAFEGYPKARYRYLTSYDTKFETIVHEMTHIWANTIDYGDRGYGFNECKRLDKTDARTNADSYANYAQQVFYLNRR